MSMGRQTGSRLCPVCRSSTREHAGATVLGRHRAVMLQCRSCAMIFMAEPDWLEEAYADPIREEDSGLLHRCASMRRRTRLVIGAEGIGAGRFLDWGGGYGVFARMMADAGLDYRHDDPYCQNLFARGLDDEPGTRYDLVTAFEVLEHLVDPVQDLAAIASRTDRILASTSIRPEPAPDPGDWDYYGLEHGQHVMFHTVESLRTLGRELGFELTTNGINLHLFHRTPLRARTRLMFSPAGRRARVAVHSAITGARAAASRSGS